MQDYISAAARRIFRLAPIRKRKVVFCSYYGRGYSDSPKAIANALLASGENLELVWLLRDMKDADSLPTGIKAASWSDPVSRAWHLATARVWVDNCRKGERCKRKGQFYLQTWHGFALKRIERDTEATLDGPYIRSCIQDSRDCDLMVSGSEFMTGLYRNSFWYEGEVLPYGTPRNDIFFGGGAGIGAQVRRFWSLPAHRKLLLYAPTFRADHSTDCYSLDAAAAAQACRDRFGGEWTVLIRLHPNIAARSKGLFPYDGETILDATAYPDMLELLVACDLLITDYSSSMFDYALSGRPCVQFATDIEAYRQDRGFYFPLDELPFPMARDNGELCRIIRGFDTADQQARWAEFAQAQGFCEDGQASARCARRILDEMKG